METQQMAVDEMTPILGAICQRCDQRMGLVDSCTDSGSWPYGRSVGEFPAELPKRCHDCNVAIGGHHHFGCDLAHCVRCGTQSFGMEGACDCAIEDDP
jgi:hypothetical protein